LDASRSSSACEARSIASLTAGWALRDPPAQVAPRRVSGMPDSVAACRRLSCARTRSRPHGARERERAGWRIVVDAARAAGGQQCDERHRAFGGGLDLEPPRARTTSDTVTPPELATQPGELQAAVEIGQLQPCRRAVGRGAVLDHSAPVDGDEALAPMGRRYGRSGRVAAG
jgi:hypothetical protein